MSHMEEDVCNCYKIKNKTCSCYLVKSRKMNGSPGFTSTYNPYLYTPIRKSGMRVELERLVYALSRKVTWLGNRQLQHRNDLLNRQRALLTKLGMPSVHIYFADKWNSFSGSGVSHQTLYTEEGGSWGIGYDGFGFFLIDQETATGIAASHVPTLTCFFLTVKQSGNKMA